MRIDFNLLVFLVITCFCTDLEAKNYALIAGGAAQRDDNEFLDNLSSAANGLVAKNWETKVLFDSDYRPSEWDRFSKNVRPKIPGEKAHQFSFDNLTRELDNLLSKNLGPNDQVALFYAAHGAVAGDLHRIDWQDNRGKGKFKQVMNSLVDSFTPTKDILPKLRELLKRGVKLHFNTLSCYDGQLIKDFKSLIDEFPNQFCLTTSTLSDRPAFFKANDEFLNSVYTDPKISTVADKFKNFQNDSMFISSLADQQSKFEKMLVKNNPKDKDSFELASNYCLLAREMHLLPLTKDQLSFIAKGTAIPIDKSELDCQKFKTICSEDFNIKAQSKYFAEVEEVKRKIITKTQFTKISYEEFPSLIKKDARGEGRFMYSLSTSLVSSNVSHGSSVFSVSQFDLANLFMQNFEKYSANEKKGIEDLKNKLAKDPENFKGILNLAKALSGLKEKYNSTICNRSEFQKSLIKFKSVLLEANLENNKNRACEQFKI